jgi:3-methyladenine DNA glycosylase Tag
MPENSAPDRQIPQSLGGYLEVMSKAVFQSGMSWRVVDSKWPELRDAMRGFDIAAIATMSEADLEALAQDTRVIRNRRKLAAIVDDAQRIVDLDDEHGDFKSYLGSHASFDETVKNLRAQFKFLGETGSYFFLYMVGEEVPPHEEWMRTMEPKRRR